MNDHQAQIDFLHKHPDVVQDITRHKDNGGAHDDVGVHQPDQVLETQWPEPLAPEAFHGLAGELVQAIEPHSEADPAALLVQMLVCFGNIIGPSAHWFAESTRHALNLFAVLVGSTSKARKGTSLNRILKVFSSVDPDWRVHSGGLSSAEGLIWAVRDGPDGEDDRQADPGVQDKRFLVVEEEYASALRVMERLGNTLSPILRQAWDGLRLSPLTKNDRISATGSHIGILGHITRDELRRYLTATEMGNGFANRFLWICCQRRRYLPRGGAMEPSETARLINLLQPAVVFGKTVRCVVPSEPAWQIWDAVYEELSGGRPGLIGAVTARAEAQVMRLAAIYALMDQATNIQCEHMKAALAIWEYNMASVRNIFSDMLGNPLADAILRVLKESPDGMTRTEIRDCFGRNQSKASVDVALGELATLGVITREMIPTGGRPTERWRHSTTKTT